MHKIKPQVKIAAFTCNWSAYSAIEKAGLERSEYPASVKIVRLACLARANTGMVLQALEMGANGVLLLGCPPEECHYGLGAEQAHNVLIESRKMLSLLGIPANRVKYIQLPAAGHELFVTRVHDFSRMLARAAEKASPLPGVS